MGQLVHATGFRNKFPALLVKIEWTVVAPLPLPCQPQEQGAVMVTEGGSEVGAPDKLMGTGVAATLCVSNIDSCRALA